MLLMLEVLNSWLDLQVDEKWTNDVCNTIKFK